MANCRSCAAEIEWAVTTSGKIMPVNALPDENGNLLARRESDGSLHVRARPPDDSGRWVDEKPAMSHFATCPDATRHRRGTSNVNTKGSYL